MVDDPNPKKFPPPPLLPGGIKRPPMPLKVPPPPSSVKSLPPPGGMIPAIGRAPGLTGATPAGFEAAASQTMAERVKKMEEQSRELEESKRRLERALSEMELKLKEEKEKALSQAIKAREEESLSLKMEQALKEMQEKSRRDRREQELEEARQRAEEKVKDLDRRLNEEREAWVINLKKQMELRDSETKQVESQIEVRFRDLERRWLEEKSMLTQALKSKEDEIAQLRATLPDIQTQSRRAQEDAAHTIELARNKFEQELETKQEAVLREKRNLAEKLDLRERELISLKAQLAMIDSQVRAAQDASQRHLQEKERTWQFQLSDLQKDLIALRQIKDQMQTDLTRANAENIALRKEIGEWDRKQNQSEQRVQEIKFAFLQSETQARETVLRLQEEVRKKTQDFEALERNYFSERQSWTNKLEEKALSENSLWETFALKEKEAAELKTELASIEHRLEQKFQKEKAELLSMAERQLQEELSLKAELMHRELSQMRELVLAELSDLENQVQAGQLQQQSQLSQKEAELSDALNAMNELQKEILEEKKQVDERMKASQEQFESERRALEMKVLKERESFEIEKQKGSLEMARKIEEALGRSKQEAAQLRKELEEKTEMLTTIKKQFQKDRAHWEEKFNSTQSLLDAEAENRGEGLADSQPHLLGRIWKYLTRTVIILNLRSIPRIKRSSREEELR